MAIDHQHAGEHLRRLLAGADPAEFARRLLPRPPEEAPLPPRVPGGSLVDVGAVARRWAALGRAPDPALWNDAEAAAADGYARHIENLVGAVRLPVGVAGPLRVNGLHAYGDYHVPLATTEAALVASYHRGAMLVSEAGGGSAFVLSEGVTRAPGFVFGSLADAGRFCAWAVGETEGFRQAADLTTRHGELTVVGRRVSQPVRSTQTRRATRISIGRRGCSRAAGGFAVGLPDRLDAARQTFVVKTVSVLPAVAGIGLGRVLVDGLHAAGRALGYRRAIHSLMHDDNVSRHLSARFGSRPLRRYALFSRRLP